MLETISSYSDARNKKTDVLIGKKPILPSSWSKDSIRQQDRNLMYKILESQYVLGYHRFNLRSQNVENPIRYRTIQKSRVWKNVPTCHLLHS